MSYKKLLSLALLALVGTYQHDRAAESQGAELEDIEKLEQEILELLKKDFEGFKEAEEVHKPAEELSKKAEEAHKEAEEAHKKAEEAEQKAEEAREKSIEAEQKAHDAHKKAVQASLKGKVLPQNLHNLWQEDFGRYGDDEDFGPVGGRQISLEELLNA